MILLAEKQAGYLGHESVRDGLGITVSYWKSLDAIKNWKAVSEHVLAQELAEKDGTNLLKQGSAWLNMIMDLIESQIKMRNQG